jgi:hypothetical protein
MLVEWSGFVMWPGLCYMSVSTTAIAICDGAFQVLMPEVSTLK